MHALTNVAFNLWDLWSNQGSSQSSKTYALQVMPYATNFHSILDNAVHTYSLISVWVAKKKLQLTLIYKCANSF